MAFDWPFLRPVIVLGRPSPWPYEGEVIIQNFLLLPIPQKVRQETTQASESDCKSCDRRLVGARFRLRSLTPEPVLSAALSFLQNCHFLVPAAQCVRLPFYVFDVMMLIYTFVSGADPGAPVW